MTSIVATDDIRSGDPRIEGTRITVLDVKRRVIDNDEDPHVAAGEYGLSMADLFHGLAFYYDNREEFERSERQAAASRTAGEARTRLIVDETLEQSDRSS